MINLYSVMLLLLYCHTSLAQTNADTTLHSKTQLKLHKLEKLWVTGDFDGDGKTDTLRQHTYSALHKKEIVYAADPFHNEWDDVVNWFNTEKSDVYLTLTKSSDTLRLGTAQGLYCLINLGKFSE